MKMNNIKYLNYNKYKDDKINRLKMRKIYDKLTKNTEIP